MTDAPGGCKPLDRQALGGDLIFQDHRQDTDEHLRYVVKGCRIEKEDATFGLKIVEGNDPGSPPLIEGSDSEQRTVGDIHPWLFWPGSTRDEGSWNPCFAAIVLEDEVPTEESVQNPGETRERSSIMPAQNRAVAPTGDQALRTQTREEQDADRSRRTLVLPVRTKTWREDVRYQVLRVAVPPDTPELPKGTPGVVLAATREKEEILLFLPTQNAPLVCVNNAGDPDKSSLVYDLLPDNRLDPDRAAQLHTAWRVIPPDESACDPRLTPFPILAWQLGLSGQDRHAGCGLVHDAAAGPLEELEEEEGQNRGREGTQERESAQEGEATQERGGEEAGGPEEQPPTPKEKAQEIQRRIADLLQRKELLQSEINTLVGGVGQGRFVDPSQAGKLEREIGRRQREIQNIDREVFTLQQQLTELNEEGETKERGPNAPPEEDPILPGISACASSKLSGCLEVGGVADVHRIGRDVDGNPINALHIPTSALIRGGPGDGPQEYENIRYHEPDPLPLRARSHKRWDPLDSHEWVCGEAPGKWKDLAETVFLNGEPPGVMPDPDSGGTAGRGDGGGGGGGGGGDPPGDGGDPEDKDRGGKKEPQESLPHQKKDLSKDILQKPNDVVNVKRFGGLEDLLGLKAGSLSAAGATGVKSTKEYNALVQGGIIDADGLPIGGQLKVGDNANTRKLKLGGKDASYATVAQCLRTAGGQLFRPCAAAEGQEDFTRGGFYPNQGPQRKIPQAPDTTAMVCTGNNPLGRWESFELEDPVGYGLSATGKGMVNVVPPRVTPDEILNGGSSTSLRGVINFPPLLGRIGLARPLDTGELGLGGSIEPDVLGNIDTQLFDALGEDTVFFQKRQDGSEQIDTVTDPATSDSNTLRFYSKTNSSGQDVLHSIDDAGTVVEYGAVSDTALLGEIKMWGGDEAGTIPANYAICAGQTFLRTDPVFAVIGTLYGAGDGMTTANYPDYRGRGPIGVNNVSVPGGADGALSTRNRGNEPGAEDHTLTEAQIPDLSIEHTHQFPHSHTSPVPLRDGAGGCVFIQGTVLGAAICIPAPPVVTTTTQSTTTTASPVPAITPATGGGAHNNMQPSQTCNFLIRIV